MTLFSIASLSVVILCTFLSIIVFSYSTKKTHYIWAIFNVIVALWGIGIFMTSISKTPDQALIFWRWTYLPCTFISVIYYHVIVEFCGIKRSRMLAFAYIQGFFFLPLIIFSKYFVGSTIYLFNSVYYHKATFLFFIWLLLWFIIVTSAFVELYKFIKRSRGVLRTQAVYLFWGMILGHTGGAITVAPSFHILIYPAWHFLIGVYAAICTYAIFRYQLMDIKIAVTRIGVFIFVYSIVLGMPVWLGLKLLGKGLWLIPVTIMGIFATIGPFIYLFIQKKAEDRLLQEQRRYQATLRQASAGMGKIKDLKKLLNMIVYVLTHAIQIEHALVYIHDEDKRVYILGASKRRSGHNQFISSIEEKSSMVQYLRNEKNLIVFEEIKQRSQDFRDLELAKVVQAVSLVEGELIVPIFIDQSMIAIIVMGKKESGKLYTGDDLTVFGILANQTALAIENAKFYEDMKSTQEQLFKAEKMATIGTMADGLSHQINNRFHALGFIAGDAVDTIRLKQKEQLSDDIKELLTELERAFARVEENVKQGGEIVQGLLKYTRKGDAAFTAVDIDAVLKAAVEMTQFKIKTHELKIVREYDVATMPKVKGNFTQLQEVFFNLIDNGYDAMMQRKTEAKEEGYQLTLIVRVLKEDGYAQIIFEDNGMGVRDEDMRKLFTPFFTTKLSSKKGTGLGLYVIKKIVEDNHGGKVDMVSKYMHGTQMKLRLPIAIG